MRGSRIRSVLALLVMLALVLAGCSGQQTESPATGSSGQEQEQQQVSITFWTAPNPTQEKFWREMADAYMKEHPNVKIEVAPIPESPSSEAGILTALSSGTKLTASENVFVGFGAQLANNNAIVPLDTLPGFNELVQQRKMEELIEGWRFPDGHIYIFPLYSNAMLFGWRMDILKELGYDQPPRTYSEILELAEKLRATYKDKFLLARKVLVEPQNWWERWFDTFTLYYAASGGKPFLQGNQVVADEKAFTEVLRFYAELAKRDAILTRDATDPFETGVAVWNVIGPWTLPYWKEKYPELKVGEQVVFTPPPVPDGVPADQATKTFADAKGVVIYRHASEAEQQAAWEFIRWVLSNPENDAKWLQETNLPPARGDLAENAAFQETLSKTPGLEDYARAVPTGVPPVAHAKFEEIHRIIGEQAVAPVVRGEKSPEQAWQDMKRALEEAVQ
ncbi:MAG TPA: extracellular solute-binding protein [Thermaerobacter sp.]